jgi:mono/diheme cytochrome c family protein
MRRLILAAILAPALAACASDQSAQQSRAAQGAALRGRAYAEEVCAVCHAVGAGESRSPNADAPPFETVANTPGMTPTALAVWLNTSHPSMPNLIVDPHRVDDLSAYLQSLKHTARPAA